MAELVQKLEELRKQPPELHIFCPRENEEDNDSYIEDLPPTHEGEDHKFDVKKHDRIQDAKKRRQMYFDCMQLFAFDASEAQDLKNDLRQRIDNALSTCDICIREYYLGKQLYLRPKLRDDYDDPEVDTFFEALDKLDIERICRGLTSAKEELQQAPPEKRTMNCLRPPSILALFEALSCEAFLNQEDLLKEFFNVPFQLVQTKRPLRTGKYTIASTLFLFDSHATRLKWATSEWTRFEKPPTEAEFDWTVRDFLSKRMEEVTVQPTPFNIQRFWRAMSLILNKLEKQQITHNLRALDIDVCRLALEHFSIDSPGLQNLLLCFQKILQKASTDFWDAMAQVRPSTVVEQIFHNPRFDSLLNDVRREVSLESTGLGVSLSWIPLFLDSIKPANQPVLCRTLVDQLLQRTKKVELVDTAKIHCFQAAMDVLEKVLQNFLSNDTLRLSTERGVLTEIIDIVTGYPDTILEPLRYKVFPEEIETGRSKALDVIRLALSLETMNVKNDYQALVNNKRLQHNTTSYSKPLWDIVISRLNEDDTALSKAVLSGVFALPGLEDLPLKAGDELGPAKKSFNLVLGKLTKIFAAMLERLSEFRPEHLDELFKDTNTSMIIVSGLSFADDDVYHKASDLIKNVSGQFGRKEAMAHLLQAFFDTTLNALSYSYRRLARMKTFAGVRRMLKTGMDVLDILTDSQTGLLRIRPYQPNECFTLRKYWTYQWQELQVVFQSTERWNEYVQDKEVMKDFCRDAMQYTEALFEQYTVFANAITEGEQDMGHRSQISKQLLEAADASPGAVMSQLVRWLRLRDDYLINTLVTLCSKLFRSFSDHGVKLSELGPAYVENVALSGTTRTKLTQQQKAELVRALEAYNQKPYSSLPIQTKKKQKSLKEFAWEDPAAVKAASAAKPINVDDFADSDVGDDDLVEIIKSIETKKTSKADIKASEQKGQPLKQSKPIPKARIQSLTAKPGSNDFLAQRQREREEAKRRNAEAAARLRGSHGIGVQTKGQGSGLHGLVGVEGKDHTSGTSSMMVSSDSDSDSDSEDEIDRELFGTLKNTNKSGKSAFPVVKNHEPAGPIKKIKQLRSAKDMRARLAPDLSALHRTILSWDFFANGDLPPNANKDGYTLVSNAFRSALEYQKTFEPLLILESWQSFRSAREDGTFKAFEMKVANRVSVDNFLEVSTAMSIQQSRDMQLREADVVLLSSAKQPWADVAQPHCLARIMRSGIKKGERELVFRIVQGANNTLSGHLTPGTNLYGTSILSLTPLEREYGGLSALQYYDLCDEVLRAKPSPLLDYSANVLSKYVDNYNVNLAQAKAIKSALDNDAFTLIQGPPGSGKTKTICALVGAILSASPLVQKSMPKPSGPDNGRSSPQTPVLSTAKKVLVCAPSNAAVDELVMRFKSGVKTMDGKDEKISVVRLGRSEAINTAVKDVTIEELVNAKMNVAVPRDPNQKDLGELMKMHKEASEKVIEVRNRLDQTRGSGQPVNPADTVEMEGWKRKKNSLGTQIDAERDKKNSMARDLELNRRRIQQEVIDNAHVICATLSGSGHDMFQNLNIEFDIVIIDEAAQSVELSALIPLKYGCSKCILVGDPRQLPPTVLSKAASKYAYEQSLFARMEKNHPKDVHLLDTQYRMHPEISAFPSREFYESRLKDGADMAGLRTKVWHRSSLLGPYRFFDVQGMHQSAPKGHSLVNIAELNVAMQLYERLITDLPRQNFKKQIGIITPYKGQLKELKHRFSQRYGEDILSTIDFNTTDAFQGRECEIIIFSCVRASTRSIGFLDDVRRMNVGLTRAKSSLWVLGSSQALMMGEYWKKLVLDAKARSLYTDGDIMKLLQRPALTADMLKLDIEMTGISSTTSSSKPTPVTAISPAPAPESHDRISGPGSKANSPPSRQSPISLPQPTTGPPSPRRPSLPLPSRPASAQSLISANASSGPSTPNFEKPQRPGTLGPSGGANGLNDLQTCAACGSFEHYTYNCNNSDAQLAANGLCNRCQGGTHKARDCKEVRCLECGAFGHEATTCTMRNLLPRQDKERIARQEASHKRLQQKALERARERQLGEHGARVPVIKTSLPPSVPKGPSGPSAMRKPSSAPRLQNPARPQDRQKSGTVPTGPSNSSDPAAVKRKRSTDTDNGIPRAPKVHRQTPNEVSTDQKVPAKSSTAPVLPSSAAGTKQGSHQLPPRPPAAPAPGSKGVYKRKTPKESDMFVMPKKR